ncbi:MULTISPECIES: hypothetical protein [unclassified Exiguobacterium]|uniref:hypothetical protein n=1 Tax=unclassified Exiguobacterium TaxID=2644629 RepID=UPI001BE840E2|nr:MULTISPECIES: hypothetical protein [unclassified Exiguobacterium]
MKKLFIATSVLTMFSLSALHPQAATTSKKITQNYTLVDSSNKKYTVSVRSSKALCHKATSNDSFWIKNKDELCTGKFTLYLNGKATKYSYNYSKNNPYVRATHDFRTSAKLKNTTGSPNVFSLSTRETYSFISLKTYSIVDKKLVRHPDSIVSYGMRPKMTKNLIQTPIYVNGGEKVGFIFHDFALTKNKLVQKESHSYLSRNFDSKTYNKGLDEWDKYSARLSYFVK